MKTTTRGRIRCKLQRERGRKLSDVQVLKANNSLSCALRSFVDTGGVGITKCFNNARAFLYWPVVLVSFPSLELSTAIWLEFVLRVHVCISKFFLVNSNVCCPPNSNSEIVKNETVELRLCMCIGVSSLAIKVRLFRSAAVVVGRTNTGGSSSACLALLRNASTDQIERLFKEEISKCEWV